MSWHVLATTLFKWILVVRIIRALEAQTTLPLIPKTARCPRPVPHLLVAIVSWSQIGKRMCQRTKHTLRIEVWLASSLPEDMLGEQRLQGAGLNRHTHITGTKLEPCIHQATSDQEGEKN